MIRTASILVLATLLASSPGTRAAESYDNCKGYIDVLPTVISSQGTWCLRKDISTNMASGSAITISTNNVTLDCNDFKIGGLGAGIATNTRGISANNRDNFTVRNCNIRGFYRGIEDDFATNHLIVDNRFEANRQAAIYIGGSGHAIRGNIIVDSGGTPNFDLTAGIQAFADVDIIDNTIDGVAPPDVDDKDGTYGISISESWSSVIRGNRIRSIDGGTLAGRGIATQPTMYGFEYVSIEDNHLSAGAVGAAGAIGISCDPAKYETVANNRFFGFVTALSGCDNDGGNIIKS